MSNAILAEIDLHCPEATADLAARIGARLAPGDALGLEGPVGAGKSHFARALIQGAQRRAGQVPEDVPSPTFTLVQTYEAGGQEIWHCDLYRLSDPSEALELGLDEALNHAICLVEWPNRLGPYWPQSHALTCRFAITDDQDPETYRRLTLLGPARWKDRLAGLIP